MSLLGGMAGGAAVNIVIRAVDDYSKNLNKASGALSTFGNVGAIALKAVSVAAAVTGAAILKASNDYSDMSANIVKGTGATGKELKEMIAIATEVGKSVPQSFDEVSKTTAELNTRLGVTGEDLKTLTKDFSDFARISGTEGSVAVANVTRLMGDWGIELGETTSLLDKLSKAGQASGADLNNLTNLAVTYGVQFRSVGFEIDDIIAMLAKFEVEGVATEKMMGGLSMALGRMAQAGLEPREEFGNLITRINEAESEGDALRMAIEILGTRAGPDFALAVREGRFELDDFVATIQDSEGAMKKTAENSLTLSDQFKIFKDSILGTLMPLGEKFMPILTDLADRVLPIVAEGAELFVNKLMGDFGTLFGYFEQAWVFIKPLVDAIMNLGATIGTVLMPIIEPLSSLFMTVFKVISDITTTIINLIATVLEGLAPVFEYLAPKIQELALEFGNWWEAIQPGIQMIANILSPVLTILGTIIGFLLGIVIDLIKWIFKGIGAVAEWVYGNETLMAIFDSVGKVFEWLKDLLIKGLDNISITWEVLKEVVSNVVESMTDKWRTFKDFLINVWDSIWSAIKTIINFVIQGFENMVNNAIKVINVLIDAYNYLASAIGKKTFDNLSEVSLPKLNDFVITNGQVYETHPDDTIVGFKGDSPFNNSGSFNIHIDNIYGTDPDEMAIALENKLMEKISI